MYDESGCEVRVSSTFKALQRAKNPPTARSLSVQEARTSRPLGAWKANSEKVFHASREPGAPGRGRARNRALQGSGWRFALCQIQNSKISINQWVKICSMKVSDSSRRIGNSNGTILHSFLSLLRDKRLHRAASSHAGLPFRRTGVETPSSSPSPSACRGRRLHRRLLYIYT